jgi:hypothetical protein
MPAFEKLKLGLSAPKRAEALGTR